MRSSIGKIKGMVKIKENKDILRRFMGNPLNRRQIFVVPRMTFVLVMKGGITGFSVLCYRNDDVVFRLLLIQYQDNADLVAGYEQVESSVNQ